MDTQEQTSKQVSVKGQFTQNDIPKLLEKVNAQIKSLTSNDDNIKVITKELPGFDKIHSTEDVVLLLKAVSSVKGKSEAYDAVAAEYLPEGFKKPAFELAGHSSKEWLEYLKSKIATVAHKKQIEKLKAVKKTLEENLSQEAKLANDLAKIAGILAD